MPNFDSGAYFLTVLCPVETATIPTRSPESRDSPSGGGTSPVHDLRKALAELAPAQQTTATCDGDLKSPFSYNLRAHFARFVVIDDFMFVGRKPENAWISTIVQALPYVSERFKQKFDPIIPQPQDHLRHPYLFFSADFDARDGSDESRDSFLRDLWSEPRSREDLKKIFCYCRDFSARVRDDSPESFAKYIADCQVETTMPFHDYWMDNVPINALPQPGLKILAASVGAGVIASFLLHSWLFSGWGCLGLLLTLIGGLAAAVFVGNALVLIAGSKPFPAAPNSTLPEVLKSLHVKNAFTQFIIDNQLASVDPAAAGDLQRRFREFLEQERPDDLQGPTQSPGVIGF
jgi:hypothetical protein